MKMLPLLVILLLPFTVGARTTLADGAAASAAGQEAKRCTSGPCVACPNGGSTEPSSWDCQRSGGYVVGTPECNDGGCGNSAQCVCCDWPS